MDDILERIVGRTRERVAAARARLPENALRRTASPPRPFFRAGAPTLIAECKQASPSRGLLDPAYDPAALARAYAAGGADALSVLTEPAFFRGADADLAAARAASGLPALRKDFTVDAYQVREAWALGADAILLIAAVLDDAQLREYAALAGELGLSVLVEAHTEEELARAVAVPAAPGAPAVAVGINCRDLRTFATSLDRLAALVAGVPAGRLAVAESGIHAAADAAALRGAGFDAFLVGEHFVRAADRTAAVRAMADALAGAAKGERCAN